MQPGYPQQPYATNMQTAPQQYAQPMPMQPTPSPSPVPGNMQPAYAQGRAPMPASGSNVMMTGHGMMNAPGTTPSASPPAQHMEGGYQQQQPVLQQQTQQAYDPHAQQQQVQPQQQVAATHGHTVAQPVSVQQQQQQAQQAAAAAAAQVAADVSAATVGFDPNATITLSGSNTPLSITHFLKYVLQALPSLKPQVFEILHRSSLTQQQKFDMIATLFRETNKRNAAAAAQQQQQQAPQMQQPQQTVTTAVPVATAPVTAASSVATAPSDGSAPMSVDSHGAAQPATMSHMSVQHGQQQPMMQHAMPATAAAGTMPAAQPQNPVLLAAMQQQQQQQPQATHYQPLQQ